MANVKFHLKHQWGAFTNKALHNTHHDDSVIEGEFEHKEDKKID